MKSSDRLTARHGAAARLAQIKRATALAFDDLGQRIMMVPQPEKRPEAKVASSFQPATLEL